MQKNLFHWMRWMPFILSVGLLFIVFPIAIRAKERTTKTIPSFEHFAFHHAAQEHVELSDKQGVVQLKVTVPNIIRAGENILYTYSYTNTGTVDATDVELEVKWVNFALLNSTEPTIYQYCATSCDVEPGSVVGPAVRASQRVGSNGIGLFTIGTLKPGESGRFSILLRSTSQSYPKTNQPINRPSGSGRLFINRSNDPTSEMTTNTMIVGPILSIIKQAKTTEKIYPLQQGDYTLIIGNATGTGDIVDGNIRVDSRNATNIVIEDTIPAGSAFVSASHGGVFDATNKKVKWTIPTALAPGKSLEVQVSYKKLDEAIDCGVMQNITYSVTSDEMPMKDEATSTRYSVVGSGKAAITIVNPLELGSITANPSSITYGDQSVITFVVQNFYHQPINGAQLLFTLPTDVVYVSANPPLYTQPDSSKVGGKAVWTLNIPAGTIKEPAEATFTLTVKGYYNNDGSRGEASLVMPEGVPSQCIKARSEPSIQVNTRLTMEKKLAAASPQLHPGDTVSYQIDVTNASPIDAKGIILTDVMPGEAALGACFAYIPGTAKVNGTLVEPSSKANNACGSLVWENLTVPAKGRIAITYDVAINGFYYNPPYCNTAKIELGDEVLVQTKNTACIQMQSGLKLTKKVDKLSVTAGDQVRFTLTLVNTHESNTYRAGLYDALSGFTFVKQEQGYASPVVQNNELTWPLVQLGPKEQIEVTFVASPLGECLPKRTLSNEALFLHEMLGKVNRIRQIPAATVSVDVSPQLTCPTPPTATPGPTATPTPTPTPDPNKFLRYFLRLERTDVSLKDEIFYTVSIENTHVTTATDIVATVMLPQGFLYNQRRFAADSTIKGEPKIEKTENRETKLTWTIRAIGGNKVTTIKFPVTTSEIVGQYTTSLSVESPSDWKTITNPADLVAVIMVKPLVTIAPSIKEPSGSCEKAGRTVIYELALINTNVRDYDHVKAMLTLPTGLKYIEPVTPTMAPRVSVSREGLTILTWNELSILKRPANQSFTQQILQVKLSVGKVWKPLKTQAEATSPDGIIPRKEGVDDAIIQVCPPNGPDLGKVASNYDVYVGNDEVVYTISLVNPEKKEMTNVEFSDMLPEETQYMGMVEGPEPSQVFTRTLIWSNLNVPAATHMMGDITLRYRLKFLDLTKGRRYRNSVTAVSHDSAFQKTESEDVIVGTEPIVPIVTPFPPTSVDIVYLPVIARMQ